MDMNERPQAPSDTTPPERAWMLAAIGVCFLSLFLTYDAGTSYIPSTTITFGFAVSHYASGFAFKPYAVFVLIGLAAAFCTRWQWSPFWRRHGYWISAVLFFLFTPWYAGFVCLAALSLAVWAMLLHHNVLKRFRAAARP